MTRCHIEGGGPQAMSMCIVEGRQQRPGPPTAACGGNGGRARWARGLAAAAPEPFGFELPSKAVAVHGSITTACCKPLICSEADRSGP